MGMSRQNTGASMSGAPRIIPLLKALTQAGGGEGEGGAAGVASVPPLAGGHHGVGARGSNHQGAGHTHCLGHPDLAGVLA